MTRPMIDEIPGVFYPARYTPSHVSSGGAGNLFLFLFFHVRVPESVLPFLFPLFFLRGGRYIMEAGPAPILVWDNYIGAGSLCHAILRWHLVFRTHALLTPLRQMNIYRYPYPQHAGGHSVNRSRTQAPASTTCSRSWENAYIRDVGCSWPPVFDSHVQLPVDTRGSRAWFWGSILDVHVGQ